MLWILLSLNAALFFALRYAVIKKYCSGVSSTVLALTGRLTGFLVLLPLAAGRDMKIADIRLFWTIIVITAVLTAAASLMQLHAVKRYDLSSSVPFLSFVPLFMLASVYALFDESPSSGSLWGIFLLVAGAYILNIERGMSVLTPFRNILKNRGGLLFFGVAVIFGVTTSLDRVAIDDAGGGGFAYSLYWHLFSIFIFAIAFLDRKKASLYVMEIKRTALPLFIQGVFSIIAFVSQMMAVQLAKDVAANVIYVKGLTMVQLLFGVMFGITLFGERNVSSRIAGSVIMISGALIIILFA